MATIKKYYVVRCHTCGRLGSYEPPAEAQARVDVHLSSSGQAHHDVVITKHPKSRTPGSAARLGSMTSV